MTINERINKKLKPWGLTVEDLTEEELAEAKECLKPGTIDGFFSSEVLIKKSLLKSIERKKANTKIEIPYQLITS